VAVLPPSLPPGFGRVPFPSSACDQPLGRTPSGTPTTATGTPTMGTPTPVPGFMSGSGRSGGSGGSGSPPVSLPVTGPIITATVTTTVQEGGGGGLGMGMGMGLGLCGPSSSSLTGMQPLGPGWGCMLEGLDMDLLGSWAHGDGAGALTAGLHCGTTGGSGGSGVGAGGNGGGGGGAGGAVMHLPGSTNGSLSLGGNSGKLDHLSGLGCGMGGMDFTMEGQAVGGWDMP
jgi:hypothetical protein